MSDRLQVTFHPSLPEHSQRLMAALDVDVRFDEDAPARCECEGCRAYRRSETLARVERELRLLVRAGVCPMHRLIQPCLRCQEQGVEP